RTNTYYSPNIPRTSPVMMHLTDVQLRNVVDCSTLEPVVESATMIKNSIAHRMTQHGSLWPHASPKLYNLFLDNNGDARFRCPVEGSFLEVAIANHKPLTILYNILQ